MEKQFIFERSVVALSSPTGKSAQSFFLPDETGTFQAFKLTEKSNLSPELTALFPDIKSYHGKASDGTTVAISYSPEKGMQALIFNQNAPVVIEPTDDGKYVAYRKAETVKEFTCGTHKPMAKATRESSMEMQKAVAAISAVPGEIRRFRLALTCDHKYAAHFGGTVSGVMAAFNATMTTVNAIYERDFGVRMEIIPQTVSMIYLTAETNPYGNASGVNARIQANFTKVIGSDAYDIGHLFSGAISGGNAGGIGLVCASPTAMLPLAKGSAYSGHPQKPGGPAFDVDYVCHEMGHQFGDYHTHSYVNEGTFTQMEPGSGSTIMGYAGITPYNLQKNSDAYFHYISIFQARQYVKGLEQNSRIVLPNIKTGNRTPTVNVGPDVKVPKGTPFVVTGTASDKDNQLLTHCIEQIDSGVAAIPKATTLAGPKFRSWLPSKENVRHFPRIAVQRSGVPDTYECLPFSANVNNEVSPIVIHIADTVRDGFGEIATDSLAVTFSNMAGPFVVTAPNKASTLEVGSTLPIAWNVAGTTVNGINCTHVDIYILNEANQWILVSEKLPNSGNANIIVPNIQSNNNRIIVKANGNIFYNMSVGELKIIAKTVVVPPVFEPDVDDNPVSNAPLNLQAKNVTKTSCEITWDAPVSFPAVGYSVYLNPVGDLDDTSKNGNPNEKWVGSPQTKAFLVKNLVPGPNKIYVKAKDKNGVRSQRVGIIVTPLK